MPGRGRGGQCDHDLDHDLLVQKVVEGQASYEFSRVVRAIKPQINKQTNKQTISSLGVYGVGHVGSTRQVSGLQRLEHHAARVQPFTRVFLPIYFTYLVP